MKEQEMISFDFDKIAPICGDFGVELTPQLRERLTVYGNLLVEWNEKMNLTAITEPDDILYKHFLDCLLFLKHVHPTENARLIDVGTGAGFPGMVLLIARPDLKVTLLDGLNKRLVFLQAVLDALGLSADVVHLRA
ncbi:MAG: 16S rRNA (guanine(527)-N(7))-methyltransferase RsmG, partial [Clostridia bacterium]|nr:16S rRNA (guanine(527)-N(7))-methyltransferase RsmG [Clostridia bacterium]